VADRPRVLIEDWLPVAELGIESRREAAPIPGQFPKLKTLHVWWARRPLAASAGVVLGSVMPSWSPELAAAFPGWTEVSTEKGLFTIDGVVAA
jgi:adenine-specific DNA methylase